MAALLADDFVEIGSSGRVFTRAAIIETLQHEAPADRGLTEFRAKLLAPGVMLTTYRVVARRPSDGQTSCALRSSIWKLRDGRWPMHFHQGTVSHDS
ncbi:MAG TPA: DUF4440 domain-containing protein [Phycisphaerae bacterium]